MLENAELEIDCPNCKRKFKIKVKQVGTSVTCPSCKSKINLQDDGSFAKGKTNVEKEMSDFKKNIKNLFK